LRPTPHRLELMDTSPNVEVQDVEYCRLLGYPAGHAITGRAIELAAGAREWYAAHGSPWIYARESEDFALTSDGVRSGGSLFHSANLREILADARAHSAALVAVCAGPECEERTQELWRDGKPDEYFFLEMYGAAVVEHLIAVTSGHVCAWADSQRLVALPHHSPGYEGWDVSNQSGLWDAIVRGASLPIRGRLEVLLSGMLRPKKAQLGLIGLTRHGEQVQSSSGLVACERCSLPGCRYRRLPYRWPLPQLEDVRRLQPAWIDSSTRALRTDAAPNPGSLYRLNTQALRKWSRERLQMQWTKHGAIEARFRYEGTTCSNLGHPLEYEYLVTLGPASDGYPILDALCSPAPGDLGHASQCEYLLDPERFSSTIRNEKPLLGHPLNDILIWTRPHKPSGCYCDVERRMHKWGLVFEVIHYALTQQAPQESKNGASKPSNETKRS